MITPAQARVSTKFWQCLSLALYFESLGDAEASDMKLCQAIGWASR
jgi:hypothetical protein